MSHSIPATKHLRVAMVVYPDFNMLDLAGGYVFFSSDPRIEAKVISVDGLPVASDQGLVVVPDGKLEMMSGADVIWVPGGFGAGYFAQMQRGNPLLEWLAAQEATAQLLCSVCTGAFIAAAAGWFDGYTATTHWQFQQELALFPGVRLAPGFPRYWLDRNRMSGGGVSSGMDEALAVIAILLGDEAAMQVQLLNQYAPEPAFNAGTPETAPPRVIANYYKSDPRKKGGSQEEILAKVIEQFLHQQ